MQLINVFRQAFQVSGQWHRLRFNEVEIQRFRSLEFKNELVDKYFKIVTLFWFVDTIGTRTACFNNANKCSELCKIVNGTVACSCSGDKQLLDGYRCVKPPKAGLNCNTATSFLCSDGLKCVQNPFICDGDRDCEDGSDEHNITCSKCHLVMLTWSWLSTWKNNAILHYAYTTFDFSENYKKQF